MKRWSSDDSLFASEWGEKKGRKGEGVIIDQVVYQGTAMADYQALMRNGKWHMRNGK
jgi:hypothetical protein